MVSIESIYQTKINEAMSAYNSCAARNDAAVSRFAQILSIVEEYTAKSQYAFATSLYSSGTDELPVSKSSAEIEAAISKAANATGVDPDLIRAVIQVESSFRVNVVSGAGAQGLMQLMPGTAKEMGVTDPFDAYQNVLGGAGYLKKLINRFGDVRLALAAYNTGQGRIAKLDITDPDDPEQYSRIASGVRGYVDKVLDYYNQFSKS